MLPFKDHRTLYLLMFSGLFMRALAAAFLELGNDEVYYWTYALYPAWSHFDHPPMVGYVIRLFTLDLIFDHAFFIRLPALVSGTISTYLLYLIVLRLSEQRTAVIAAFLFTASIYGSIISGVFIMPDAPLLPLWLGALYSFLIVIRQSEVNRAGRKYLLLAGLLTGLGMLSKYHAVFLWSGAVFYFLLYDRKWLLVKETYLAMLISALCLLPVLYWNLEHDFISFRFQGERVSFFDAGFRPDRFATELSGQIFYNNPFVFALIALAVLLVSRGKVFLSSSAQRFLLLTALPLIAVILFFSMFRKTLPHWSGPAYITLIPLAAAYVAASKRKFTLKMVSYAVTLLFFLLAAGLLEVNLGILTNTFGKKSEVIHKQGKYDVTLDMYGWQQFGEKFRELARQDSLQGLMKDNSPIIAHRWFTAAHLDYYVAHPQGRKLLAFGTLKDIHKYAWINARRGLPELHSDAYYITNSREFKPVETVAPYFARTAACDTVPITRRGKIAEYFFVYRMKDYQDNFPNPLPVE